MSLWSGFARRWLDLPTPRCAVVESTEWIAGQDGTRLGTGLERPRGPDARATLVLRTAAPVDAARSPVRAAARLLAEQGHAVVVQTCRGLHASEGRFHPFLNEARDGADLLAWTARQPWFRPPLVVGGFGYGGHAAWAALGSAQPRIEGLVVGFAPRDPYAWLYADRALRLDSALEIALALATAESPPLRAPDPARALRHRPLREADRVALRRISWWQEWLDHPRRDAYWEERTPRPVQTPARALLIGGFRHPALPGQLEDHARLVHAAAGAECDARLLLGSWDAEAPQRRDRRRRASLRRSLAGAILDFLDSLCDDERSGPAVRAFVSGADRWRDAASWPPPGASERVLHLTGDGRAAHGTRRGALRATPAVAEEAPDRFVYDPADATPSDPACTDPDRGDRLRHESEPLDAALEIAGTPCVEIFATSSSTHTDFAARLTDVAPNGQATSLGFGLVRDPLRERRGEEPQRIEIALPPVWHRVAAGNRLRLEIASSCHPLHDRHPNTADPPVRVRDAEAAPAIQRVWHDAMRPSRLRLPVLGSSAGARDTSGPPARADGPDRSNRSP